MQCNAMQYNTMQCMHACIYIYMCVCMYVYIYIFLWCVIQVRGLTAPPMVWVPRTRPLDPDSRAVCSISELQLLICTLFAPLRSPNFSLYNLCGLFTSLETIFIYMYMRVCVTKNNTHIHRGRGDDDGPLETYIYMYITYIHTYT